MIAIRVEGADELIKKLTTLAQLNKVRARIGQEGIFLRGKMTSYPTKVYSPNPLIKSSEKVRKAFFAKMKSGEIGVPYRRTGNLKNHWSVEQSLGGFSATVGNNASYAPLVQSANQATRHATSGWLTDTKAVALYGTKITERIRAAVEQEVKNV